MLVRIGKPLEVSRCFHAAAAEVSGYTISFRQLELRLTNGIPGWNVTLSCIGTETFRGPVEWSRPCLKVDSVGQERVRISDARAGFEAFVEQVWVGEAHERQRQGCNAFRIYSHLPLPSDPGPLLSKWRGGLGCVLSYEPFVQSADLRVGPEPDNLRILCFGVKSFQGRGGKWEGANLQVERRSDGLFRVHDRMAGVEVIAERVHVMEMEEPNR